MTTNKIRLNNGFEIPQIGVGTWTLRGETARQNVRLALEAGFRHIDTAQAYENEAEVGQGIIDSGVARQEIFLTTKVNTGIMREGRQAVSNSIDESLDKLKTDYIDLLLIHWPVKDCVKHTWQVMEEYVRKGPPFECSQRSRDFPLVNEPKIHHYYTRPSNHLIISILHVV